MTGDEKPVLSMFYGIVIYMYAFDNRRHHRPPLHAEFAEFSVVIAIDDGDGQQCHEHDRYERVPHGKLRSFDGAGSCLKAYGVGRPQRGAGSNSGGKMGASDFPFEAKSVKDDVKPVVSTDSPSAGSSGARRLKAGETAMFSMRTTAAKRKAAASRLLRGMPPAAKAGRKPAHVLLAESRGGR